MNFVSKKFLLLVAAGLLLPSISSASLADMAWVKRVPTSNKVTVAQGVACEMIAKSILAGNQKFTPVVTKPVPPKSSFSKASFFMGVGLFAASIYGAKKLSNWFALHRSSSVKSSFFKSFDQISLDELMTDSKESKEDKESFENILEAAVLKNLEEPKVANSLKGSVNNKARQSIASEDFLHAKRNEIEKLMNAARFSVNQLAKYSDVKAQYEAICKEKNLVYGNGTALKITDMPSENRHAVIQAIEKYLADEDKPLPVTHWFSWAYVKNLIKKISPLKAKPNKQY
jgi:hypothetical protein